MKLFNSMFTLETVSSSDEHYGSNQDVPLLDLPTIPIDDHEAVSAIEPDLVNGPWIAGGAPLRWYQNQLVGDSDIDVFCANAAQAAKVIEQIKSYNRFSVKYESDNAITIGFSKKGEYVSHWTIQIITRRYFSNIQEVINSFDISVCQIGTTGNSWHLGSNTAGDIRQKNLRFNVPLQQDTLKRLTKYWVYGYRPVPGTIEMIRDNPVAKWQFSDHGDYENAF